MKRLAPLFALVLAAHVLSGCDEDKGSVSARQGGGSYPRDTRDAAASARAAKGRGQLNAYAPATDFSGVSPEDASRRGGTFFDGSADRDAVASGVYGAAYQGARGPARGKQLSYTTAASERTKITGQEPPLPDDYDYSKSGATRGSAAGAGQTLLGFAKFQLDHKFDSVAPIMSRLGWHAAPRAGSNQDQTPYRVTVHHTQGHRAMTEAEAASDVKGTQHYHMVGRAQEGKDAFSDIGYHFLIAGDGRVIEGRHAEYLGAHVRGGNSGNVGISMMGDFNKLKPTDAQIESLTRLVTYLAIKYKKDPMAKGFLEGHQHYNSTDCPGKNMMAILDALRRKIDHETDEILAGRSPGAFVPLAVLS